MLLFLFQEFHRTVTCLRHKDSYETVRDTDELKLQSATVHFLEHTRGSRSLRKKKKKLQISIHIVLTNYKYTKSLFLNTLKKYINTRLFFFSFFFLS